MAKTLVFVDAEGGALSALAAGAARSLGIDAKAATSIALTELPREIGAVLSEVGMGAPPSVVSLDSVGAGSGDVVFLGTPPPPESLAGTPVWEVALYDGPGDLERLATARIARDQIERRLTRMGSSAK